MARTGRLGHEKVHRTINIKVLDEENVKDVEKFQMLCVWKETHYFDMIVDLIQKYNRAHPCTFQLISEGDLLDELHKDGFKTTRGLLKKYRDMGALRDKDKSWWFTDGSSIVYNFPLVRAFIRKRSKTKYERINGSEG